MNSYNRISTKIKFQYIQFLHIESNTSVYSILISNTRIRVDLFYEISVMHSLSLMLYSPIFSPMRTFYAVSDNQSVEIRRNQKEEGLDNIEASRKRLEEIYQALIKVLDESKTDRQEEIKALAAAKKEKVAAQ